MNICKDKIERLIKNWIIFREDELTHLTKEDKKHTVHYEAISADILNKVPRDTYDYVSDKLEKLTDDFFHYCDYYNEKYYRTGFGDCLSLIISTLGGND